MAVVNHHSALFRQPVDLQKADIMRRKLVFDARIAKPHAQFHAGYFLPSGFLASPFLASAPSSSVSCLPFLMTSGSAGVAPASAAAASGVGATSSFTEVTWATV